MYVYIYIYIYIYMYIIKIVINKILGAGATSKDVDPTREHKHIRNTHTLGTH